MKKFVLAAVITACLILLGRTVCAADVQTDSSGGSQAVDLSLTPQNQIEVSVISQTAAEENISSLQLSIKIEVKSGTVEDVSFEPCINLKGSDTLIEYRYHRETGILNIYVAGSGKLFKTEAANTCVLGGIKLSGTEAAVTVSVVEGSLEYVAGTKLESQDKDVTYPDVKDQHYLIQNGSISKDSSGNDNSGGSTGGSSGGSTGGSSGGGSTGGSTGGSSGGSTGGSTGGDSPNDKDSDKKETLVITFHKNGGSKVSQKEIKIVKGEPIGTLPKAERKNYAFAGWYTAKSGGTKVSADTVPEKSATYYAHWKKVSKPSKAAVTSVKAKDNGKLQVKYKKVSGAKGYEIVYSTSKSFASSKTKKVTVKSTNKTLSGLKKNTVYYVKVRAYKVDSAGQKIYGKYSTVKKVRTKTATKKTTAKK